MKPTTTPFGAAILAGGASRRMGRDKALIRVGGIRLVDRVIRAAAEAGAAPIVVVGGDEVALDGPGHRWVPDRWPGEGPLGGIITALSALDTERVVVLACDHVAASADAVAATVAALDDDADVVIPVHEGRDQTLHSAWRRLCAGTLERHFADGDRSVQGPLAALRVRRVHIDIPDAFVDADTPGDLLALTATRYHQRSSEEERVTVPEIDVEQLDELDPTAVQLIDVREADEYEEARVRGTVLVPLATVPDAVEDLDRGRRVYVICASGGRSQRAAEFLVEAGFDAVNVAGGTKGWIASGRPVDSGPATA